ncbi:rpoE leader peptide RseD [Shigella flexneri]
MTNKKQCVTELYETSTLSICLLIVKLMEWRFEGAWKFGLGRLYLG